MSDSARSISASAMFAANLLLALVWMAMTGHFDLANLGSVCAVLTEDRGRMVIKNVEWLGRTPGASPRGCSLATAQLLDAQHHD